MTIHELKIVIEYVRKPWVSEPVNMELVNRVGEELEWCGVRWYKKSTLSTSELRTLRELVMPF